MDILHHGVMLTCVLSCCNGNLYLYVFNVSNVPTNLIDIRPTLNLPLRQPFKLSPTKSLGVNKEDNP